MILRIDRYTTTERDRSMSDSSDMNVMKDMNRRSFLITTAATAAAAGLALHVLDGTAAFAADAPSAGAAPKATTGVDVGTLKSFDKDGVTDTYAGKGKGEFFLI